ncbi:MAG: insulinase family protein [Clostridia bacterium]|nr:insulinase family protein [Clostridia bacterium]
MIREKISDRISLNISQTDKFKTNFLSIFFSVPLEYENATEYALLPKVLLRGSGNYPDMKSINRRMDQLYGANMSGVVLKRGERQVIGFMSGCLCNKYAFEKIDILKGLTDLINDLLFNPNLCNGAFLQSYVESEKKNHIDYIKSLKNNKNQYAVQRCREEMCKNEAYGISEYGSIEQTEKVTPESLYRAYKNFISVADIDVFFVGKCDKDVLTDDIKKMFSSLTGSRISFKPQIITSVSGVNTVTEEMNINQGKLTLGFRSGTTIYDEDYSAFSLFNEIFGGSPSSKLFMNVREKLSLCYYCSSSPEAHKGLLFVASGIEVENKEKAQQEILNQLEEIQNGNITDTEFDSAVKSLINAYSELDDDPYSLSLWYYGRFLAGNTDTPETAIQKIMSLTKEDVIKVSRNVVLDTVYFLKGVNV